MRPASEVTVWWLEQRDPAQLRPAPLPASAPELVPAAAPDAALSRWYYETVGAGFHWVDRLGWADADWRVWADRPELGLWECLVDGARAGYAELERQPGGDVEVAFLGLLEPYRGHGLGGWLLTRALEEAWALPGTRRVWLHTCALDDARALPNYRARGLELVDETVELRDPDTGRLVA